MTKPDDLVNSVYRGECQQIYPGLTKREYFSVMAMQGLIQRYGYVDSSAIINACDMADLLIDELNTKQQ